MDSGGVLTIEGTIEGTPISIYNIAGQLVGTATASNGTTTVSTSLNTHLKEGSIAIVKIGEKAVKVMVQ